MVKMEKKQRGLIPFFIPHIGCPHICVFCNQHRITGQQKMVTPQEIRKQLQEALPLVAQKAYKEVAFYGGSFTALSTAWQEALLAPATEAWHAGLIDGIRCSTRPDTITEESLEFLIAHGVKTIELGVQSMDNGILERAQRGHTAAQVEEACRLIRQYPLELGLQVMPGLPGETWLTLIKTTVAIGRLQPDFTRIYPVLVIAETELADMYARGEYEPLSLEKAVAYSAFMQQWFENKKITVIRTGLQATEELDSGSGYLAGPYAPAMGEMVSNARWQLLLRMVLYEHETVFGAAGTAKVYYPRSLTSKVRGLRNRNRLILEKEFGHIQWYWQERAPKEIGCSHRLADERHHPVGFVVDGYEYSLAL